MKKVIIGVFLSMIGALGSLTVFVIIANNMVSGWSTPPGRFLTTVSELGMTPLLVVSSIILVLGLIILAIEYFRKEVN
jgi:ABC-type sulfate transport system permease component